VPLSVFLSLVNSVSKIAIPSFMGKGVLCNLSHSTFPILLQARPAVVDCGMRLQRASVRSHSTRMRQSGYLTCIRGRHSRHRTTRTRPGTGMRQCAVPRNNKYYWLLLPMASASSSLTTTATLTNATQTTPRSSRFSLETPHVLFLVRSLHARVASALVSPSNPPFATPGRYVIAWFMSTHFGHVMSASSASLVHSGSETYTAVKPVDHNPDRSPQWQRAW
jgi:hypothetical protein